MIYDNMTTGHAGINPSLNYSQQKQKANCEKRNTIEDQMRNLRVLIQRIEQIKANVRWISDQICGVSGTPPECGENSATSPGHLLYRLSDTIRDGMDVVESIDRELLHIRSALSDDANSA